VSWLAVIRTCTLSDTSCRCSRRRTRRLLALSQHCSKPRLPWRSRSRKPKMKQQCCSIDWTEASETSSRGWATNRRNERRRKGHCELNNKKQGNWRKSSTRPNEWTVSTKISFRRCKTTWLNPSNS
jgi:hypothetical protein